MPTPFKDHVNAAAAARLGAAIRTATPTFDVAAFVADAARGLDALELKARIDHVATALSRHLPASFPEAAHLLCRAATLAAQTPDGALTMWTGWPCVTFVERYGLDHPAAALDALACLTPYASAEFAIRPFIERHPDVTWPRLGAWARSENVHLRRLASEGTRPRLPWGRRLTALVQDPSPTVPLLDALRDDPEEYVRRSVANHLNDISKDHPGLAIAIARRWTAEGGAHVERVVRHALRDLVKAGHPDALSLRGAAPTAALEVADLHITTPTVTLGESLHFDVTLVSRAAEPVRAIVDYVVHHRRAGGTLGPKVFKLTVRTLAPGERVTLTRAHPMRPITTRRYYPGEHRLEIQVNGARLAAAAFDLRLPHPPHATDGDPPTIPPAGERRLSTLPRSGPP
jgi:3-methyladenine DNA glycosylase AlkC